MEILVQKNGQQTGPYDEATVRSMLNSGELAPTDLAYLGGASELLPLQEVLNGSTKAQSPTTLGVALYVITVIGAAIVLTNIIGPLPILIFVGVLVLTWLALRYQIVTEGTDALVVKIFETLVRPLETLPAAF